MAIDVLLVDSYELIRLGLRRVFEETDDLRVVAEAGCADEAQAQARLHQPDVVVLDMDLADGAGLKLLRGQRAQRSDIGIVALVDRQDDGMLFEALEAGASAFLSKWAPCAQLVTSVRSAAQAPASFTATDLVAAMQRRDRRPDVRLTEREDDVLQLLSQGLSVAQVSSRLFISASTAKTHMAKLYDKLGANNRTQAVMAAVRLGLVETHAVAS